jgi:hypothetical protein
LIIGIADPADNCEIIGLTKGQENRKNQANLIDFLRNKPFAGGIRPELEIETILLSGLEIDVIKIKDIKYFKNFLEINKKKKYS